MTNFSLDSIHALQIAMQNEKDTIQIYEHMLNHVRDSKGRELIHRLIIDEHQHQTKIKEKILLAGGRIAPLDVTIEIGFPNRDQIFEMELENCSVSELINIALQSEQMNRDFYDYQFKRARNKEVKNIFKWLMDQEELHIQNLRKEYQQYLT